MCALLVVAAGCAGYVLTDRAFKLNGIQAYSWVSAYFVIISFEMAYGTPSRGRTSAHLSSLGTPTSLSLLHTQHSRLISTPLSTLHTGKHIVGPHLQFASMWGPTLYTNTISVPPMLTIGLLTHEPSKLPNANWTAASITLLLSSLVIGVAISYLGWRARSLVTATCYTVLGVANKMLTVLANAMVRAQHTHTQSVTPFSQNAC